MSTRQNSMNILYLMLAILVIPKSAFAYLDPGSGSVVLQILLGGLAGLAVVLKLFWHQLLALLGISKKKGND